MKKSGLKKILEKRLKVVQIGSIKEDIDEGKIDEKDVVKIDQMKDEGVIRREKEGVRIIQEGEMKEKVELEVDGD